MPLFAGEDTRATARGMAILAMTAHGGDAPATAGEDTRATTHEAGSPPTMDCCACLLLLFGVCTFLTPPPDGSRRGDSRDPKARLGDYTSKWL